MREKILEASKDLFLNLGFKSVTMDEIASNMGVSKKTIYKYFKNKTALVAAVADYMFETICCGIDGILEQETNPIDELFAIKKLVMNHLKNEKASPFYQFQKYYPKIFTVLRKNQFEIMQDTITDNLERGIKMNLYRENLNKDFISRIYFYGVSTIKDQDNFPLTHFSMGELMNYYLEYHIRGIATEKGIQELKNQLTHK
ncbi:TetR/AcrR family transcriptional regulator [uncultured Polaribacter sp.]|uniref:TetR/AcrR family transcriptional regulator n=1 Tax=uncultured Polaribacter sp. TaxID=174711 RepID=UPI002635D8CF|nr:TetR/AcrR family transcriptional regulator [uncultured Polaribacter sp.]